MTASQFVAAINDSSVDVIELAAGTYSPGGIKVNANRTRPVLVRPAAGATVVFANGTDAAFTFGYGGVAANIALDGLIFDGYRIGSIGIIWLGNAHDIRLTNITVRNSQATSDPTMSWALYLSYDAGVGASSITADNWTVTGSGRGISALQVQYAALHSHVHMSGWNVSHCAFAIYANANASDLVFSNWTITDCGVNSSSVYFGRGFGPIVGSYSNLRATSSYPLLNESNGGMVNAGGNTFS
jgi:hypothetical protein